MWIWLSNGKNSWDRNTELAVKWLILKCDSEQKSSIASANQITHLRNSRLWGAENEVIWFNFKSDSVLNLTIMSASQIAHLSKIRIWEVEIIVIWLKFICSFRSKAMIVLTSQIAHLRNSYIWQMQKFLSCAIWSVNTFFEFAPQWEAEVGVNWLFWVSETHA